MPCTHSSTGVCLRLSAHRILPPAANCSAWRAASGIASAAESAAILDALRLARAKTVTVTATVANDGSDGDLGASLAGIAFPVAIKIVSPDIAHKTEAGGVMLDVADLAAVRQGLREMLATVRSRRPD